jgi:adenine phosphoribosyltransferase
VTAAGGPDLPIHPPIEQPNGPLADRIMLGVRDVPDYPQPGVMFKDITPLLADPAGLSMVVAALCAPHLDGTAPIDLVAGIEARGFILGAPMAMTLGVGFVPLRKRGKLPHHTLSTSYQLEYGSAELEVHADGITAGQRVLIVDDVLATGGTAAAACELVELAGGTVTGVTVLLELGFLVGRSRLPGREVCALVQL